MQQIVQLVSEIYMIALCLLVGPADQKEIRIDQVGSRGLVDTLIIQRTDKGFAVHDERSGQRLPFVTLERQPGKQGVFVAKGPNGREEVIDLSAETANLAALNSRRRGTQALKTKSGAEIRIARSGLVTYVNEARADRTYVVHSDEPPAEKAKSQSTVQTVTQIFALKYGEASKLAEIIKPILGGSGHVVSDERTNALVVTGPEDLLRSLAELIARLDVKTK